MRNMNLTTTETQFTDPVSGETFTKVALNERRLAAVAPTPKEARDQLLSYVADVAARYPFGPAAVAE